MGFFDAYPAFFGSSRTGASPSRLNARYEALIESNHDAIAGQRILDIASHDGRWTFAALAAGARHVTGFEARASLVERARNTMLAYGVAEDRFDFVVGDAVELVAGASPGAFDTVFCYGFLYHTLEQMPLIAAIGRLQPKHLLLDTAIVRSSEPLIVLRQATTQREGDAVRRPSNGPGPVLVGMPSLPAVEMMLESAGFEFSRFDWTTRPPEDWSNLDDYRVGERVILRARPKAAQP